MRSSLAVALLLALSAVPLQSQTPLVSGDVVPDREWQTATPESVGYSSAMLEVMRGWLKTQATTSM